MKRHTGCWMRRLVLSGLIAVGVSGAMAQVGSFSEPATVFYGKVLGTDAAQPFMITEGALVWTILRADGVEVTLEASLFDFNDGLYSYRLQVPHDALALDLEASPYGIPMPPMPETHLHVQVTVDGEEAALLGPAASTFTTEQLLRTASYRMDLAIGRAATDSDGDGIPDWWEDAFGLDKQDGADADSDANGDGVTALDAYLAGLDPNHDHRGPALVTEELVVYPAGRTALLPQVVDVDSAPTQLVYRVTGLPAVGALLLCDVEADPAASDRVLAVGDTFTQADVLAGRVVYAGAGDAGDPGVVGLTVRDEQVDGVAASGSIRLLAFQPPAEVGTSLPLAERLRLDHHQYAGQGMVIADAASLADDSTVSTPDAGLSGAALAAYEAAYGAPASYVLVGGAGEAAVARGGAAADVLVMHRGAGTFVGGGGADLFVAAAFESGLVTVADFAPAEGDVLDLSWLPVSGEPGYADQWVRLMDVEGVAQLQVDLDGDGVGYTNLAVALPGVALAEADLYAWVAAGTVRLGALKLEPRVRVVVIEPVASENGPTAGRFRIERDGSLDAALTVDLQWSGPAQNGSDYEALANQVVLPAGVASVDVVVTPYADSVSEPTPEAVVLTLLDGDGYRVGAEDRGTVTISDLLMLLAIEVIDEVAVVDTQTPGLLRVSRQDVLDRDVFVRLEVSGSAAAGSDYQSLVTSLVLAPYQTTQLIPITPLATAQLAGGMETVRVSIRPDAAYRIADGAAAAQVKLIERYDTYDAWAQRMFDAAPDALARDGAGPDPLQRYAFGLDAHAADPAGMPRMEMAGEDMIFSFRRPLAVTDVAYRLLGSSDLMDWSAQAVAVEAIDPPAGETDPQRVYYRVRNANGARSLFTVLELEWTVE